MNLGKYGKLTIVTDLHGNFRDYKKYLDKWDCDDHDSHIIFTGDLIHAHRGEDGSVLIIEDIMKKYEEYENFHLALGNHEWSHIVNKDIYKNGVNQKESFEELVSIYQNNNKTINEYITFFKKWSIGMKTVNGLFISHTGPSLSISSEENLKKILKNPDYLSTGIEDILWNRYYNFQENEISNFLENINSKLMVVGHTNVNGYKTYGKQLILTSSYNDQKKAYLEIDLGEKIETMNDLTQKIKYL